MKFCRVILFILIIIYCAAAYSCGGGAFTVFQEIPDADLGSEFFEHLIENLGQCQNVYSHLFVGYVKEHSTVAEFEDDEAGYFDLYEAAYKNWREKHPDKVELIRANIPKLYDMVNRITHRNRVFHYETMKHVIDSYVSAVYINSPAPVVPEEPTEPLTGEDGELIPPETTFFPPINIDYARESISQYISADFSSKNPQKAVADYLNEHNIHVKRIVFDPTFAEFNHHVYPFRIEYKYRIYYYIGDTPVEDEQKWQTATVRAVYFLTMNENREYAIAYISDPAVMKEIINPDDPKIEDFE